MSLELQKYSVKPRIPLKTIPVNPKISVVKIWFHEKLMVYKRIDAISDFIGGKFFSLDFGQHLFYFGISRYIYEFSLNGWLNINVKTTKISSNSTQLIHVDDDLCI